MAGFFHGGSGGADRSAYGGRPTADRSSHGSAAGGAGFRAPAPGTPDRSAYGVAGRAPPAPPRGAGFAAPPVSAPRGAGFGAPAAPPGYATPPSLPPRGTAAGYSDYPPEKPVVSASTGYTVATSPKDYTLSNCIVLNPHEWRDTQYVIIDGAYAFTAVLDRTGTVAPGTIGVAMLQRRWARLSIGQGVTVTAYDPRSEGGAIYLGGLDLEANFLARGVENVEPYSTDELAQNFTKLFKGHVFSVGQELVQEFHGQQLLLVVKNVQVVDPIALEKPGSAAPSPNSFRGVLVPETTISYNKAHNSLLKLKGSAKRARPNAILQPNFKFEDLGVGGLDEEFSEVFRRSFSSRTFPPALVERLGIQHVKGIILYGPPGTGKTLLARQIGKMLNANEPKVVNGPEILNKYVGASEENIRKLFADAEKEYKEKGDDSDLHIIIFDELDAVFKQRGTSGGGTGVGDSVVNQLLSKMDGVDQLNNILIIGMTNRLDMIDEALLRPGRLEVRVEISLPDEHGRAQILNIQTATMRKNGLLDDDVDLGEIAALTKNFSGAEIAGLVRSATSFAFTRHIKVGTTADLSEDVDNLRVNRDDFFHALEEVHPAYGVSEESLQAAVANGIMKFAPHIDAILRDGAMRVGEVRQSSLTPLVTALLHGPPGSGKTALAATIALQSGFPFIQIISPEQMIGMNEPTKVQYINKVFNDAYKSPLSVIVIDNFERMIEWAPIGPRFQNTVSQALATLLNRWPPKGRRLLVLVTSSNKPMLEELEVSNSFSAEVSVPAIESLREVDHVLRATSLFESQEEHARCMTLLSQAGLGTQKPFQIGIKKLISNIEMARLDEDPADKLLATLNFL